ncbi:hypothetical protein ACS5PK_21975, partial [Roseateles sp. DB2]|uniref:RHS repeat domain-containing protein n=1 Tax=Roseateles sp. DB2 TaxID=3453717 RepID=UPI003EEF7EE4
MVAIVSGSALGLNLGSNTVLGSNGAWGSAGFGRAGERVYVNAATGNLVIQGQDELLAGLGLSASALRTYNSQGALVDDNGDNWLNGPVRSVRLASGSANAAGSVVIRRDEDGSEASFSWDAGRGRYISTDGAGAFDSLSYDGTLWTFVDGSSRRSEVYGGARGQLQSIRDADGNALTLSYGANGLLSSVSTASGEVSHYDYNASRQLTQVRTAYKSSEGAGQDSLLTRVRYAYDGLGRLSTVTVDLSPQDNSVADARVFTSSYTYDGDSQRVASITQSDGAKLSFTYDGNRLRTFTDALGGMTILVYDTVNRKTEVQDALGQVTTYWYDTLGRLKQVDSPAVAGVVSRTTYDYNGNGDVTSITDAEGRSVSFEADAWGNMVRQRDAAGNVVRRVFNAQNQLLSETVATAGEPAASAAATRYVYDASGVRLRFVLSAEGRVTEYRYGSNGLRTASIQYADGRFSLGGRSYESVPTEAELNSWVSTQDRSKTQRADSRYDWRGQLLALTTYGTVDANGNGVLDGTQAVTQYVYGTVGLLLKTIDARNGVTQYTYDGLGRMLTSSNALNQLSTTSYDDAGGVVTSRLFNGRVSTSTYDRIGRLVSVIESDASAAAARWKASGVSLDGSGVVKTTTTAAWDAGMTSTQGIAGGASVSFRATQTNAFVMVGLKTAPDSGYSPTSLNWGLYLYGDGSLRYTVGGTPTTVGSYAVGDLLAVTHDGTTVRYFKNGQLLASLSAPTTQALYAATSHHTAGSKVDDLRFEPYTGTGRGIDAGTASLWKASGASLNGGSVVKTTTTAVWDAGVTSTQGIAGGASVSFRATQTNAYVMVGLKTDPDGGYGSSSLNWGLYLCGDGSLRYTVGGAPTPVGTYAVGDLLAVTHDGTTVHYFKNGQLLASLSAPTTQALYAATTHYTAGSKVGDLRFEPNAGADLLGEGGMTVDLHDASKSGGTPYEWSSSVRSRIGYTGGASVSFRAAQTEKHFMVGLNSDPSTDAGYRGLDWAMYCNPGGQLHVYESGVYKGGIGDYAAGDALSVSYDGKAVNYIRNGVVLRSVAAVIAQPLYADSSFHGPAAKVTDLVFEGGPIVSAVRNSYDVGGRLRMTQSATGARQWYFYDEAGRKVANVNALGLLTEFVYNKAGQLLQTVDYATQVDLTRLVDARGQASSLSLADIRPAAAGGDRKQWSIYDGAGRLAKTVTPTSSAGQGSVTEFSYDPSGRLLITRRFASTVSTSDWGASPSLAQATPGASAQDQLLRSFYDQDGLAVGSLDALGSLVENQYDAAARKVAQVQRTLAASAAQLALAQSASTALAQVRPADSGNDQKVLSFYNARGQLVGQLDGMGVFTETIYDASGNVSTQQRYSVATAGFSVGSALSSVRSAAGAVLQKTSYEYDVLNRVLKQRVDPDGMNLTTTTIYDDAHRQLLVTSPLGVTDVTQFDVNGQVERVTKDSARLKFSTHYSHDAEGRLLSSTDANGVVTNYSYDALGRKATQTVDPKGVNLVTSYSYDKQGNLARVTDPLGLHTRYVYDESGRLRYTLDPANGLTENRYDGLGKLSATVRYLAKQAGFQTVEHAQGLISNSVVNVVATPGGDQVTRYAYDAAGRQTHSVDATGAVTQYEYDAAGQLVAKKEFANAIGLPAAGSEDGQTLVVKGDYAGMYATTYADIDPGKTYKVRARLRQLSGKGYIYSGVIPKDASGNTFSSNGWYLYSAVSGHLLTPEEGWQTYEGTISGIAAAGVYDTSKFLYGTESAAALLIYNYAGNEGSTDLGRLVEVDSVELIDMSTGAVVSGGKMAAGAAGWALDRSVSGAYGSGSVGTLTATQVVERLRPSAADRVTRYAYDAAGRQTHSVDALGAVTQYEYDAAGQLVAKKEFANAIGLPEAGSSDGATVALGGQYTWLNNKVFVGIDTSKTYKVRAKLRQLSGTGSVYVGVITKDGNGAIQASNVQGTFSYCAVQGKEITPEMGWLTFEGTITGETAIAVGASYNKFFAGAKTASPLLLYNYSGNTRPSDLGRLVEVDSLELIDVATGTVINANAAMAAGSESWDVVGSIKGFAGVSLSFSADDIRQRLRPDAADRVTRYTYDAAGRQTHSVDAAGAVTQYEYDAAGHLVAKKEYANAIGLPEAGSSDGATVALGGHYGMLNSKVFVSIDTSRTYKVRAKLRQLSGTGSVYVGVITKDSNGAIQASNVQGSFSYCAEQGREITPEMGWVTFEGTITGETAIAVGASYNKFFAGAKTASPLLLYNYGGNTRPGDLGRLVEVDSLELIDVATGTVINANAAMAVGGESWAAAGSIQGFAGGSLSFRDDDIRQRLRPDAADRVTRYVYDAAGRQTYSVDAEGYVSEQRLDAQGRVTQTLRYTTAPSATVLEKLARTLDASALGSAITTSERQYDAAGRLVRELDAERVERRYEYDDAGRLVLRTDAAGLPEERRTRYGYDAAGRLTRKTEADGSAVARSWVYEYDALGQLVTEFDPRAQQLTEQDDASARQLRQRLGYSAELGKLDASARRALRLSHASHYTYDAVGRQLTRTDALGGVTTTRYDALGQAVAQVDAMGSTRYWVYNAQGRVVQEIDAERYLTLHRYDTLGNRIETVQVNARVQGSLRDGVAVRLGAGGNAGDGAWVPLDVERDAHSSRRYDALGRVLSDTDAAGNTERVEYDTFGDRTAMINRLGARATLRYDRRGLLLAETLPVQAPDAQGQLRDVTHRYEYDALGLRTRSIEAEGLPEQRITEMRYNRRGQLLQRIGAAYTTVDGTLSTPLDSFSYDALGRVIEQRAHAQWVNGQAVGGRRSLAYYNALDQKIAELSADGVLGRFEYDAASNIVRQTVHATRIALPSTAGAEVPAVAEHFNDRSLQTDYDALNRKIAVRVERLYTWEEGQRVDLLQAATVTLERNRYDAKGRLIEHIDGRGNASHDYFDALGRRVLSIDALGAVTAWDYERGALATATRETRYAAMLSGPIDAQASLGDAAVLRQRVATQARPDKTADRITVFQLDALGRVLEKRIKDVTQDLVDAQGSRTQSTADAVTTYAYNGLGAVTQMRELAAVTLDVQGQRQERWEQTDTSYDGVGRETLRSSPERSDANGARVRPRVQTRYDGLGQIRTQRQLGTNDASDTDDRVTHYEYKAGLLIAERDAANALTTYAYDALGQLVRRTAVLVHQDASTTRDLVKIYGYDAAGRLSSETDQDTGEVRDTRYNAFGEIEAKGLNGRWYESAEYSALGKVIKTNAGDGATKFYLQDANGNTTREIRVSGFIQTAPATLTLAQAATHPLLYSHRYVYDARNQLIKTIDPEIQQLASSSTMVSQYNQAYVPPWSPIGLDPSGGGYWERAKVSAVPPGTQTAYTNFSLGYSAIDGVNVSVPSQYIQNYGASGVSRVENNVLKNNIARITEYKYRKIGSTSWISAPEISKTTLGGQSDGDYEYLALRGSESTYFHGKFGYKEGAITPDDGYIYAKAYRGTIAVQCRSDNPPTLLINGQTLNPVSMSNRVALFDIDKLRQAAGVSISESKSIRIFITEAETINTAGDSVRKILSEIETGLTFYNKLPALDDATSFHIATDIDSGLTRGFQHPLILNVGDISPNSVLRLTPAGGGTASYTLNTSSGRVTLDRGNIILYLADWTLPNSLRPVSIELVDPDAGRKINLDVTLQQDSVRYLVNPSSGNETSLRRDRVSLSVPGSNYCTIKMQASDGKGGEIEIKLKRTDISRAFIWDFSSYPAGLEYNFRYVSWTGTWDGGPTDTVGGGTILKNPDGTVTIKDDPLNGSYVKPAYISFSHDGTSSYRYTIKSMGATAAIQGIGDRVSLSVPGSNYCTIKMQASDGKGGEIEIKLKRTDISRAFIWDFSSYPAGLEYKFRYVSWTGTWDGGPIDTVGGGTILKNPDGTVTIKDDPLNGSYVKPAYISFSHDGTSSYRDTIKSMETTAAIQGIGDRIFLQGANLIPQTGSHLYQMTYTGHRSVEAAGEPVTSGSLVVRVFADGTHVVYENNADYNSLPINFYVKGRQLEKIALRLTDPATKKSQFFYPLGKWVPPEGNKLGYTHFSVDARSISSPQSSLEYDLIVLDDKGQVLKEGDAEILQHGKIKFSSDGSSQPKVLERIITLESKPGVTITRRQKFNAFGEISEEADDRVLERMTAMLRLVSGDALAVPTDTQKAAARNQFHYNALGKLVEKVEPETYRTERNGYRWRARPLTSYGYDLLGRHTTTLDAAGNLTRLSYAEGARGDTSAAEYTFDAAGGSAQAYNSRVGGVTRVQRNVFGDVTRITDGEGQVTEQEHDAMGRLLSVRQRNVLRLRFNGSSTVQERRDITAFYAYDELGRRLRSTDALGNTSATRYDSLGRIVATTSAQGFVTRYSYEALTPTLPANPNPTLLNTIAALRKTTTTADGHTLKDETDHFGHLLTHTDMSGGLTTYTYSQGAQVVSKKGSNGALFNVQYDYYANGYLRTLTDFGSRSQHIYTYDNAGNRVTEGYHTYVGDIPLV